MTGIQTMTAESKTVLELLAEAEALCEKATPGPWAYAYGYGLGAPGRGLLDFHCDYDGPATADLQFIARARTLIPELVSVLQSLQSATTRRADGAQELKADDRNT